MGSTGKPAESKGMLKLGAISAGGIGTCAALVALGLSDGHELVELAVGLTIAAGFACLGRSPIHVIWGRYLTLHPSHYPGERRERIELNVLVPLNVLLSTLWIWFGFSHLDQQSFDTPLLPSLLLSVLVTLVGMETLRCVRWTGKRRGTEIVCEGPVGEWFRDFFETSAEGTGLVHRIMIFLRYPNGPKTVSRFLMLLAAILLIPSSVHASAAAGHRINRLFFGPPAGGVAGSHGSTRQGEVQREPQAGQVTQSDSGSEEERSWEEQCGAAYDGRPAPPPNRGELADLFEAAGAKAAGCPRPAQQVVGQEGVWYARSYCGGQLRSLGLTAPNYLPAILYQQAASFARARANDGVLLGASSRWHFRGGDLYVVNTTSGSYVLARRRSSTGTVESWSGTLPCQSFTTGNISYTVLPPGLVALWLEVAEVEWVWPRSAGASADGREFEFVPAYPGSDTVATATCVSDVRCTLSLKGDERVTPGSLYTSVPEIEEVAHGAGATG